jgi:hypothetical protein
MPSGFVNDPKHWHDRAAEMRALAKGVSDLDTEVIMLRLADDYEQPLIEQRCAPTLFWPRGRACHTCRSDLTFSPCGSGPAPSRSPTLFS